MNTQLKPRLSFWQIWNMSFGFLGIQYGFGLQQANLSPIFRYLDADESKLPILWLAGPITGLLIQPMIGAKTVFPCRSVGRQRRGFADAVFAYFVDGSRIVLDFGRFDEYGDGALPCACRRQAQQ
jgi:hypothetical protein